MTSGKGSDGASLLLYLLASTPASPLETDRRCSELMDDLCALKTSKSEATDPGPGTLYVNRDAMDGSKLMFLEEEDCLWVPGWLLYCPDEY